MPSGQGIKTYVLTFDGTVQNLATALGLTKGGLPTAEPAFSELHFEALVGNAAVAYFGEAGSVVSATNYGFQLPVGATKFSYQLGPVNGVLKLSALECLGTSTQKVMILGVCK
jgi:hypothetical protein